MLLSDIEYKMTGAYSIIEDFLSEEQVSALRLIGDVFIQLQTTDALSASTQEHIYAGARVIVGSWLPYSFLLENGVCFETVSDVSAIGPYLNKSLDAGIF